MKIRKINFENHSILGNINLDFTNQNGKTLNTIIFAGENGVGKSVILNTLHDIEIQSGKREDKKISFELEFTEKESEIINSGLVQYKFSWDFKNSLPYLIFEIDYNKEGWDQVSVTATSLGGAKTKLLNHAIYVAITNGKILKSVFSDVEINFTPEIIRGVTSKNLDSKKSVKSKSDKDSATKLTQLIIDVQTMDALEFNEWARSHTGENIDKSQMDKRLKRFTTAFDFMFPNKKFKRINNENDTKQIIFEENGVEMNIAQLSSGEKQIVFRGGFLLKDKESLKGSLVLVDEPEISLHPNWQLKILSFYKKLFTNEEGAQTSQIFVSTHSPFIIHNANRNDDKVIILKKGVDGKTIVAEQPSFFGWTYEKLIQEAFHISNIVLTNSVIVLVEGETDEIYFTKAMEIFGLDTTKIKFEWVGRINENGSAENTGDKALNQAKIFFLSNPNILKHKLILLYDSDTNKPDETIGNLLVRKLPDINSSIFKIGIENQLVLPHDFDKDTFTKVVSRTDEYGITSDIRTLDKMKLCNHICHDLTAEEQNGILANLKLIIEKLIEETKE